MGNVASATAKNIKLDKLKEKELFIKYKQTKEKSVRDLLIENNLYIAQILSRKFYNKGIDNEDIYQVAALGLIYAIERFDIEKGYEFSSFATPTIIGEIKKYFRDKGWAIRVPRRIQELSTKITKAKVYLEQLNQKIPNIKEIADYLNCSEEEVLEAIEASQGYNTKSLDLSYDNDSQDKDIQLLDIIGVEDKNFSDIENTDFINKFLNKLNETEKIVIIDRFFKSKTQSDIAQKLNISQMSVSRIEKKILGKLKKEYDF